MPNYSLNHAGSGSDNLTASTYPLLNRPRRSEPFRFYLGVIFMRFRGPQALADNLGGFRVGRGIIGILPFQSLLFGFEKSGDLGDQFH